MSLMTRECAKLFARELAKLYEEAEATGKPFAVGICGAAIPYHPTTCTCGSRHCMNAPAEDDGGLR